MPDYLSCGTCCTDFELSKIEDFIKHKQSECLLPVSSTNYLTCKQCLGVYKTPWSLLWHLQLDHGIQLIDLAERKTSSSAATTRTDVLSIHSKEAVQSTESNQVDTDNQGESRKENEKVESPLNSRVKTYLPFPRVKDEKLINCPCGEANGCGKDKKKSTCSTNGCILDSPNNANCATRRRGGNSITCALDGTTTTKCCLEMDSELMEIGNSAETDLDDTSQVSSKTDDTQSKLVNQLDMDMSNIINSFNVSPNIISAMYSSNFNETILPQTSTSSPPKKNKRNERIFPCTMCNRLFRQKVHLKKHITLVHTQPHDKPFKCNQCSYSTVEKSHLTIHTRMHTGEKPFVCRVCGYGCRQNCTLKHHYIKRHPHSKVTCVKCLSQFITDVELDRHWKTCSLIETV